MSRGITHLVFDLGGVIVELRGPPILNSWAGTNHTPEEIWNKWLTSDAPRAFESGQIDQHTFASQIVDELSLAISAKEFLHYFTSLPIRPFPGALDTLRSLKREYKTALFSNSNVVHWQRKMNEMKLGPVFDYHFASHLMGKIKPDLDAFNHVVTELGVTPSKILFFDDNQMNVDAAQKVGMNATRVTGFDQLLPALTEYDISCDYLDHR